MIFRQRFATRYRHDGEDVLAVIMHPWLVLGAAKGAQHRLGSSEHRVDYLVPSVDISLIASQQQKADYTARAIKVLIAMS